MPRERNRALRAAAAGVAAALVAAGCATNPATGGSMLSLVSEGQEIQMGREYRREVAAQQGIYEDSSLNA